MPSPATPDQSSLTDNPAPSQRTDPADPEFSGTPHPIGELATRPDFPQCALGALVDLSGFVGVVVEIVNQSIKVRSAEGITQRFNSQRLKVLFAPPEPVRPAPPARQAEPTQSRGAAGLDRSRAASSLRPSRPEPEPPARVYIADPDFTAPAQPINDFIAQPGFPKCTYGKHVDVAGYIGVVVEIVKDSLRIQSIAGSIRSYNSAVLKKLYGPAR